MTILTSARLRAAYGAARARQPWSVLVLLLLVHWLALGLFVASVHHNAWLFYQGGDQIWYWTTGWLMESGSITQPLVSQGWSLLLAPFVWISGPGFVAGLPGPILLQVLVFAPFALWCVYGIGARIGGRLVGYTAATLWTLLPYVLIPFFDQRYHAKYVEQFLPHPLGLTAMSDQAGVVALLGAALFTFRAVESRDPGAAVLAGLFAGFAGVVKPSSLLFLPAPFVALAAARRWREGIALAIALAPALGALALWKERGFGFVPAFTYPVTHVALGTDTLTRPYDRYVDIDWHQLNTNLLALGEVFWSLRVLQWLPFAGAIAVARRSVPAALFLSLWFWAFFVLKGSALASSVDSGSFFRLLMPAFPAVVLFAAALPLLVPRYGIEWARRTVIAPAKPVRLWVVAVAAVVLGVAPLIAAAAVSPLRGPERSVRYNGIAVPVDGDLDLRVDQIGDGRSLRLTWDRPDSSGARLFFKVFRDPGSVDYSCFESTYGGADICDLPGTPDEVTRRTTTVDRPGNGTWTYRIGVGANWLDNPEMGDIFLVSEPLTVTIP